MKFLSASVGYFKKLWIVWILSLLFLVVDIVGLVQLVSPGTIIPSWIPITILVITFVVANIKIYYDNLVNTSRVEKDREILSELQRILPSTGSIRYLRTVDFGGAFHRPSLGQLTDYYEACGRPEFEFFDRYLKTRRKKIQEYIEGLQGFISFRTFPIEVLGGLDWGKVGPPHESQEPEKLKEEIFHANQVASEICKLYDEIIRYGRKYL